MRSFLAVDWRSAYRALVAAPVVTTAAVLSLALGIGANTALFSILNSLLFKQMPADEPERLVLLDRDSITNPIWEEIRSRERQLADGVFAWSTETFDLSAGGATEPITGAWATGGMFRVLGLRTTLGRPLTDSDDDRRARDGGRGGGDHARLLAAALRRGAGRRRPHAHAQRVPFTVVGVIEPGFYGLDIGTDLNVVVPLRRRGADARAGEPSRLAHELVPAHHGPASAGAVDRRRDRGDSERAAADSGGHDSAALEREGPGEVSDGNDRLGIRGHGPIADARSVPRSAHGRPRGRRDGAADRVREHREPAARARGRAAARDERAPRAGRVAGAAGAAAARRERASRVARRSSAAC